MHLEASVTVERSFKFTWKFQIIRIILLIIIREYLLKNVINQGKAEADKELDNFTNN